jgi:hypothetical protein
VPDDEEDPEEVIPHEVQEQAEYQDPAGSEPAGRVKWEVNYY